MKGELKKQLLTTVLILIFILQTMGCGAMGGSQGSLREKLILAYQYLENMEYDNALDAFAAVIKIDEKIPEAYVGMARAYSAKGDHGTARETAAKGKEITEDPYFDDLERMYGKIIDHEDTIKEIGELLKEGDEKIPGELEKSKSGILSETLDKLWEKLDALDIYDVINTDTLVYPVDSEKGIYLILYPDGQFYLGQVRFAFYSEFLAQSVGTSEETEEDGDIENVIPAFPLEDLVFPILEGHGIQAGFHTFNKVSVLYIGEWKKSYPDGQDGICAFQYLDGSARYVYHGGFTPSFFISLFSAPKAVCGSTEPFLESLLVREASAEELLKELPLDRFSKVGTVRNPTRYTKGQYSSDFENRELFELIDQGRMEEAVRAYNEYKKKKQDEENELIKKAKQAGSPIPIDGDLFYINRGLYVHDYDLEHGLYIVSPGGKGLGHHYYILDRDGNFIFQTYENLVWFTSAGFSGLVIMDEGTEKPYSSDIYEGAFGDGPDGDVWQVDFDWSGNETGRNLVGKLKNVNHIPHIGKKDVSTYSEIRTERADSGILVTDLDGNSLGTISVEDSSAWDIDINGKMIGITERESYERYLFIVHND